LGGYVRPAAELLDRDGPAAVATFFGQLERTMRIRALMLGEDGREVSGRAVPPEAAALVARARASGETEVKAEGRTVWKARHVTAGRRVRGPRPRLRPDGRADRGAHDLGTAAAPGHLARASLAALAPERRARPRAPAGGRGAGRPRPDRARGRASELPHRPAPHARPTRERSARTGARAGGPDPGRPRGGGGCRLRGARPGPIGARHRE